MRSNSAALQEGKDTLEVVWHGRGGQGAVTAARMVGQALIAAGKYVQTFPEYGPERRGAPIKAYIRLADGPIRFRGPVRHPAIILVLDPTLLSIVDVLDGTNPEAILIANNTVSPAELRRSLEVEGRHIYTIDATAIAMEVLGRNMPNTVMLGALTRTTGLVTIEELGEQVRGALGGGGSEMTQRNLEALHRGYEEVRGE